jgi:hypothetical protein
MPDAELRKVTVGYTIEFARALRTSSPAAAFSFLSGRWLGPDRTKPAGVRRYKREDEKALLGAGFPEFTSSGGVHLSRFKPKGMPTPVARSIGSSHEPRIAFGRDENGGHKGYTDYPTGPFVPA